MEESVRYRCWWWKLVLWRQEEPRLKLRVGDRYPGVGRLGRACAGQRRREQKGELFHLSFFLEKWAGRPFQKQTLHGDWGHSCLTLLSSSPWLTWYLGLVNTQWLWILLNLLGWHISEVEWETWRQCTDFGLRGSTEGKLSCCKQVMRFFPTAPAAWVGKLSQEPVFIFLFFFDF
jgi:hypothetical protein